MDIAHPDFRIDPGLTLAEDIVHLWRVDLDAIAGEESRWSATLSEDELVRAGRFHFQLDRQHFIAGRAWLRQAIAAYLKTDAKDLTFAYSEKSKPSLDGAHSGSGLSFNISHSGGIALFAFTRSRQIGVDVEHVRHDFDTAAIAARFFSQREQEQLSALPLEQSYEAFFRCWTRKEAYIKATGDGLSLPLNQFDVSIAENDQNALLATRPDDREAEQWSLRDVRIKPGYCGALCVSGTGWNLVDWSGNTGPPFDRRAVTR
jgi:4'-phosphopantetheinyl transferase